VRPVSYDPRKSNEQKIDARAKRKELGVYKEKLDNLISELESKGTCRVKIEKILWQPAFSAYEKNLSFSPGNTRHCENNELNKRYEEFMQCQRLAKTQLNLNFSGIEDDLSDYLQNSTKPLSLRLARNYKRKIIALQQKIIDLHSRAIFFSIFKEHLESHYDEGESPFKKDGRFNLQVHHPELH